MREHILELTQRILDELSELERVVQRIQEGWRKAQYLSDDLYLDSVALNLQGFYNGIENIFRLIATTIDKSMPQGDEWHKELLDQMAMEMPNLRPALISDNIREALDEYRGFRHVARNIYSFKLNVKKMKPLIDDIPSIFENIRSEFLTFVRFLEKRAKS